MGKAARSNPLSPSFSGSITGQIPRLKLEVEIVAEIVPSPEWIAANKPPEGQPWPECPATEAVVSFRIKTAALFPSRFSPPHEWPHGDAITGALDTQPLPEVMAHVIRANPHLAAPWASLVREDVERAGAAAKDGEVTP